MRSFLFLAICATVALAQTPAKTGTTHTGASAKGATAKTGTASKPAAAGSAKLLTPSALKAIAPAEYKVKFTTTKGDFVLEVHRDWAPLGADRFYNLVRNGYFDNARFFRAVKGFMVQFGISGRPDVNRAWLNANLKDDPVKESNKRGYISFASAGPNTRTTQVFINLVDNGRLDSMGFSPFGQVVEGMETIDKLYTEYGESAGMDQEGIMNGGEAYLAKKWPNTDKILTARVEGGTAPPATAPVKKSIAPTVKKTQPAKGTAEK